MKLYSTNNPAYKVSLREAVLQGLAPDGGLFMPEALPYFSAMDRQHLAQLSFADLAIAVFSKVFADEIPPSELEKMCREAFNFPVPKRKLNDRLTVLELFHGPTLAFKDFGARFMARLIAYYLRESTQPVTILVATSGDTGSAVAHGFYQVPGTEVVLLYPSGKVSDLQEKQMSTLGKNITALELQGAFDDCQRLVKSAFLDPEISSKRQLASANSINIARLLPQCLYYFYACASCAKPPVISVPSGNFGNLTAALLAKSMGLPVECFIAATNANNVVPEYLCGGEFSPRPSLSTLSNAMDVGNPSNFARMLALYGDSRDRMCQDIVGFHADDRQTTEGMNELLAKFSYIACPHTAVGYLGLKQYLKTHSTASGLFVSTAHPAKFADILKDVLKLNITLPDELSSCIMKEKLSLPFPNSFADFKALLLEHQTT